ncbi:unnamed protein product [Rotaria magnacalcarata]|uniref:Cupin type-2 domain-containing protein n=1 Tax=Rotaria magnacalcarata TaxID=392030 RepID=A0A816TD66_9BILA|nr:unnamed protein product [Rotaria magnacalcarata]CAF4147656.1 unnamed protein product [Rotaria magnacalcarata]
MNEHSLKPVFRCIEDCETQEWDHPLRGQVKWWELINGDITSTTDITMGIAEVPVGSLPPKRGHTHDAEEVYYFLSGIGRVYVDGVETDVKSGTSVWIPANAEHFCHNTGTEPLKLLFVFARDKFSDVHYCFPGEVESKS